jgi:hypothetical protein
VANPSHVGAAAGVAGFSTVVEAASAAPTCRVASTASAGANSRIASTAAAAAISCVASTATVVAAETSTRVSAVSHLHIFKQYFITNFVNGYFWNRHNSDDYISADSFPMILFSTASFPTGIISNG